jgi:hypothetical protein
VERVASTCIDNHLSIFQSLLTSIVRGLMVF